MALAQYNYPQATGLQQLGDVLMKSSGDYANLQLRRQDEERRRAQQLADLQDQRQFAVDQRDVERGLMLSDEERRRGQAVNDATLSVLLKEGWLKPTDAKNPEAIAAAADARQARLNATREREGKLPDKLQQEADYLGGQDVDLASREAALDAKISAPPPGPPSPAEVRRTAIRMLNKAPGEIPTDKEIADALPAAAEAITDARVQQWLMAKEDAKNQIQLLRYQRTALRQSLSQLLQQGFVPNRAPPPGPAAGLSAPSPALRPATAAEAEAAAGVSPPPADPAPVSAAAPSPALSPATSLLGIAQRAPAAAPVVGGVLRDTVALPGRAMDAVSRYGTAGLRGLWNGDFSVPEAGPVELSGRSLGSLLAPDPYAAPSPAAVTRPPVVLDTLYPQVPNYGGGMRNMTDTEKSAYDIHQQAKKTGGYLFRGF